MYRPFLLGAAKVNFTASKTRVDVTRDAVYLAPITGAAVPVNWDDARAATVTPSDLERRPEDGAAFAELPAAAAKASSYTAWGRDFVSYLFGAEKLELLRSPSTKLVSNPGESERDFRARLAQAAREARDEAVEKLRARYAPRMATLQERLRKAQQAVAAQEAQAKQAQLSTAVSVGATLLSAFVGRKGSVLGRATTAARGAGRAMQEGGDVARARETVAAIQQQLAQLEEQFKTESAEVAARADAQTEALETLTIKPRKADINVQLVALAWAPFWVDSAGAATPGWE